MEQAKRRIGAGAGCLFALLALAVVASPAAARTYVIQQARDQTYFIINDHKFESRQPRVCRFFEEGDQVTFITGDPEARCLSAVIQNLSNGQTCEMWCREDPWQR